MSFGSYVRKVRDESVVYGRRVSALANAVGMYQPLGFQATFAYITDRMGKFREDEAALVRAIDRLAASRALWRVEADAFVVMRTAAKREHRRQLKRSERDPSRPDHWYGDRRAGALFAIRFTLTSNHHSWIRSMADRGVKKLAGDCLDSGGVLDGAHVRRMNELRQELERRQRAAGHPNFKASQWDRATESLRLLDHIANAVMGDSREP